MEEQVQFRRYCLCRSVCWKTSLIAPLFDYMWFNFCSHRSVVAGQGRYRRLHWKSSPAFTAERQKAGWLHPFLSVHGLFFQDPCYKGWGPCKYGLQQGRTIAFRDPRDKILKHLCDRNYGSNPDRCKPETRGECKNMASGWPFYSCLYLKIFIFVINDLYKITSTD